MIQRHLIEMKRYQSRQLIMDPDQEQSYKQKLFDDLYTLMGGYIDHRLLSRGSPQIECRLTDIQDIRPLDPDRLRAYINGQWSHGKGKSLQGGSLLF
jgi:hypothetical protein